MFVFPGISRSQLVRGISFKARGEGCAVLGDLEKCVKSQSHVIINAMHRRAEPRQQQPNAIGSYIL